MTREEQLEMQVFDSESALSLVQKELATAQAEAVRFREVLEKIYRLVELIPSPKQFGPFEYPKDEYHRLVWEAVTLASGVLSSTPATQKEVERVRAMQRVVEVFDGVHDHSATLNPETAHLLTDKRYVLVPEEEFVKLEEAADDYERVVKG
jgi:hypothetical protein